MASAESASVDLYWLPLGAGDGTGCVRTNGRVYEAVVARREQRTPCRLFHSALEVRLGDQRFTIEMAPVWSTPAAERGVVAEGPVGLPWLGRSRLFRYEVRRWRDGVVPDLAEAVGGARRLSSDPTRTASLLARVPDFPTVTWGRDELGTGTCGARTRSSPGCSRRAVTTSTPSAHPTAAGRRAGRPGWWWRDGQPRDRSPSPAGPSALPAQRRET